MTIQSAVRTHKGQARRNNEDAFGFFSDLGLYAVADGMGGHAGGEIASALAISTLQLAVQHPADTAAEASSALCSAISHAHTEVQAMRQSRSTLNGMGTTIAAMMFDEDVATICHVGHSRVYRVRDGQLEQLTEDHSLGQHLLNQGRLTPEEFKTCRCRRTLTQALGVDADIEPTVRREALQAGDIFLLCSDGVYDEVAEAEMLSAVQAARGDMQAVCDHCITLATSRGGRDDGTIMALCYEQEPSPLSPGFASILSGHAF